MKLGFIHQPERRGLFSDSGRVHGLPSLALVTFHRTNHHCITNACKDPDSRRCSPFLYISQYVQIIAVKSDKKNGLEPVTFNWQRCQRCQIDRPEISLFSENEQISRQKVIDAFQSSQSWAETTFPRLPS